jgi:hypothetical protein
MWPPSDAAGAQAARLFADLRSACRYAPPLFRLRRGCHQFDVSFPQIEKFDHLPRGAPKALELHLGHEGRQ